MQFSVLHIKFPEDPEPKPEVQSSQSNPEPLQLQFNILTQFRMPRCRIIELHILDPKKRMIGILFLCLDTGTIGLYMIFDWDNGLTAVTNTGLPFVSILSALHLPILAARFTINNNVRSAFRNTAGR